MSCFRRELAICAVGLCGLGVYVQGIHSYLRMLCEGALVYAESQERHADSAKGIVP